MSIESQLPAGLQAPVDERLQAAAKEQVVARLWDRDGSSATFVASAVVAGAALAMLSLLQDEPRASV